MRKRVATRFVYNIYRRSFSSRSFCLQYLSALYQHPINLTQSWSLPLRVTSCPLVSEILPCPAFLWGVLAQNSP